MLVAEHGLEKTGEDVYERGRRGVIYFDCEPTSLKYVQRYFSTAGRWLSHQLGDYLQLGCAFKLLRHSSMRQTLPEVMHMLF